MQLKDKRCLIVGGTSGIGLAAAKHFLEEGARLVVTGNGAEQGDAALAQLAPLGPAHFVRCDATVSDEVDALYRNSVTYLGGLDVLYHVAGGSGRRHGDGPLHECSEEGWHATLAANLTSTFLTNRAALRHFLAQRQPGVILNMASVLALARVAALLRHGGVHGGQGSRHRPEPTGGGPLRGRGHPRQCAGAGPG